MKAIWNNQTIAESEDTVVVEGNHYFPIESVNSAYLSNSNTTSGCFWKGTANYYHIEVDGLKNADAAWYYAEPKKKAENIKDRVAFWKGVEIR